MQMNYLILINLKDNLISIWNSYFSLFAIYITSQKIQIKSINIQVYIEDCLCTVKYINWILHF